MQNRQAAATSRIKKKNYHKELEAQVEHLTQANAQLQLQVTSLLEQNFRLQDQSSTSHPISDFVTLESAELGYPQQSEVTQLEMGQGLSLLLLTILPFMMVCGLSYSQSCRFPRVDWSNERRLERRRFFQARQARKEKVNSLATLHTDGTPPIPLMS